MPDLVLYSTALERCPVKTLFLELQSSKGKNLEALEQIYYQMELLKENGTHDLAIKKMAKACRSGIWYLRSGNYRIFFFKWKGTYVILHGYLKKSNKISQLEIDKAINEKRDWEQRNGR